MPLLRALLPDLGRRTLVMGILNVTPDSFSDGGRFLDPAAALDQAHRMESEGADLIDIGGESSRPGAPAVPADEEKRRVLPVIERIAAEVGLPISLDTTKATVARAGVAAGARLVNDISAGTMDPDLLPAAAELGVPVCLMHLPVRPQEMGWSRPPLRHRSRTGAERRRRTSSPRWRHSSGRALPRQRRSASRQARSW
jgi:dihydropteroate synthase